MESYLSLVQRPGRPNPCGGLSAWHAFIILSGLKFNGIEVVVKQSSLDGPYETVHSRSSGGERLAADGPVKFGTSMLNWTCVSLRERAFRQFRMDDKRWPVVRQRHMVAHFILQIRSMSA